MLSYESGTDEPGAMSCGLSHLRFFYAFQVWRRRRSSRNIIRTPKYAPKGATPQYNPYTKQRELVGPGETLQYNPYTKKREYAPEGAMPRYNPYTKQRELVGPD